MRRLGVRSETSGESTVRSNLVGNAGSRPISEAKQPWACPVLGWGTTGEAHVLYSTSQNNHMMVSGLRSARSGALPHFARQRALCVSPLSPLSSLSRLSIISLSLSLSSRLGLVILGWQWSASPGVVRFHPGLSPLLIVSLPPPTRVGTCLLFQVSSFKFQASWT